MNFAVEFSALRAVSGRLGNDPLLVQAAGGNTSRKSGGIMWIKASGTWLRDSVEKDIFVPLDLASLAAALDRDDPDCESCLPFVRRDMNPSGLRPSIETSVHGLMRQSVVLHVHCVNTIAWMVLKEAQARVAPMMKGLDWAFVPYARPGLQLSRAIRAVIRPETRILLLQNHGLVVAGETVAAADNLLREVVDRLRRPARQVPAADVAGLSIAGYQLPEDVYAHGIALMPWVVPLACNNVYYPDHAVFLGANLPKVAADSPVLVAPGKGVLVRTNAKPAVEPMLACLAEVFRRLEPENELRPLTPGEISLLLNWDAEKYRQSLKPT